LRFATGSRETDLGDRRFSSAAGAGCAINDAIGVLGDTCSMLVLGDVVFGRSSA
jgi:hypothetical protein